MLVRVGLNVCDHAGRLRAILKDGCHCRVLWQRYYRKVTHGLLYTKVNCLAGLHDVDMYLPHHVIEKPA